MKQATWPGRLCPWTAALPLQWAFRGERY